MPAVPAIIGAGGAIGSALIGSHAASSAMKLTPEESAAMTAQTGVANQMKDQGAQLFGKAMPALTNTLNYYQTLMGKGGRSAAYAATAPAAENVSDVYAGAARNLVKSGVQGGSRDEAVADLNRQKAGQIARLTTGQQGMAADKAAGVGSTLLGTGAGMTAGAGGQFGSLYGAATQNKGLGLKTGASTSAGFGGLMAQLMNIYNKPKGAGGGVPSVAGLYPPGGGSSTGDWENEGVG